MFFFATNDLSATFSEVITINLQDQSKEEIKKAFAKFDYAYSEKFRPYVSFM